MIELRNKISLVLPVYNEHEGIEQTIEILERFIQAQNDLYEIIFVDDGSTDQSTQLIKLKQQHYQNLRLVQLSRNFGHQIAITAGLHYAKGDAVIVMDADLQDPPALILQMIQKWRQGYQVVYGQRVKRNGETWFKKLTAKLFYRLMQMITEIKIPVDTGDFRLMDRQVVEQLKKINEPNPFVRGLVSWVGFKQIGVKYERQERSIGKTKYSLRKMLALALDGVESFSSVPLILAILGGFLTLLLSFIYLFFCLFNGINTLKLLIFTILLLFGFLFLDLGIIGSYLARTLAAARNRPLYIVSQITGFAQNSDQNNVN